YARNITDIDDRIIAESASTGVPIAEITARTEQWYLGDMRALGVEDPDIAPHATTSIAAMIAMMEVLVAKGNAYAAAGHVLFDVPSFKDYGRLSRRPLDEMIAGARVEVAPYKKSPADFVLWKPSTDDQPGWDSPWGRGRPGWHIECSAMIAEALGTTIDIHGGGQDLQFPHHENELAQSTCAHDGAPLAQIWMHNGFLNMGGSDKMSKSLGNVMGVDELLAQVWSGDELRLALLSAHYRQPLEWTEQLLRQSKATLDRLNAAVPLLNLSFFASPSTADTAVVEALSDDLNTPNAIKRLHELAYDCESAASNFRLVTDEWVDRPIDQDLPYKQAQKRLADAASLLGLQLDHRKSPAGRLAKLVSEMANEDRQAIDSQIAARTAARAAKNFAESDRIRDELAAAGIILEDGPGGTNWRRA
ncbi:MAG: cysteine--tRNA ligase, partial [Sandarakinorhabdus sp.]|nr:cysteine--tRNA ligase [Sandarakinorhabdus sp.]